MIEAIVFDMDGVLIDSEQLWDEVREQLTIETGGNWLPEAQSTMMGMSSTEWTRYMAEVLQVPMTPSEISDHVVAQLIARYETDIPVLPFAVEAIKELEDSFSLAIASSSNRVLIDAVLEILGLGDAFHATVSSEEVSRGKPHPDVYLEAARRLGVKAQRCAAIEDSSNGMRSAAAAGMVVFAVPNTHYPPADDALATATSVLQNLSGLPGILKSL